MPRPHAHRAWLTLVLLALVSGAHSSTLPEVANDRVAARRRRLPLAFQVTKPIFELEPEAYEGKPYLIQFKGKGDDYCAQMEPLKDQLREELGVEIRCFEVRRSTRAHPQLTSRHSHP